MLATKVVCPNCSRMLKTATPLPVGKQILCRQCGHTFGVQAGDGPNTPAPSKRLTTPPPADDAPGGSNKALLFGGIIAAVVLLMVVGSAAAIAIAILRHRAPAIAQTTDTARTPGDIDPKKPLDYCPPVAPLDNQGTPVVHEVVTPGEKPWLPKEEQEKVDQTLERGLAYIRKQQGRDGFWPGGHNAGMAALPALTLLETGAKNDDPQVLKAAEFVRGQVKTLAKTYELALCILFLDRLGDPNDKPYIQIMALRLIAGQKASGGWNYDCPILNDKDERDLLQVLQDTRPPPVSESIIERPGGGSPNSGGIIGRPGGTTTDVIITRPGGDKRTNPGNGGDNRTNPGGDNRAKPGAGDNRTVPGAGDNRTNPKNANDLDQPLQRPNPGQPAPPKPKADPPKPTVDLNRPKLDLATLSPVVKKVEALQPGDIATRKMPADGTDNSNTQFAILAIWVAGRHDVPTEKVGALIDRRFRTSQGTGGNWGYHYEPNNPGGSPAMTAAGLLGLAVGHGVSAPGTSAPKEGLDDEQIKKGFKYLSDQLGKSVTVVKTRNKVQHNGVGLYFLWSVERVGVMYNLRTFGDKDWYAWGSQMIVDNQAADGSVSLGDYPGRQVLVDTCFALLFLKRANLAQDLSKKIEYLIDIKGIGNRN